MTNENTNTEYQFGRDIEFENGEIGKIILYKCGNEIRLNGKFIKKDNLADFLTGFGDNFMAWLDNVQSSAPWFYKAVGNHSYIPHRGRILGGATAACINSTLYINGGSTEFGVVHKQALERCLEGLSIKIEMGDHVLRNIKLEDYLSEAK